MNKAIKAFMAETNLTEDQVLGKKEIPGDLDLRSLTSIPKGVTLTVGGHLDLNSLTSIPEGVTLTVGGSLNLRSLTSIPEGVTLAVGGWLDLGNLTSIPEGVTLTVGEGLDLNRLTSIPEGVTLTVGGDLGLSKLTSIPKGVALTVGGWLFLNSLTSIPKGVALTVGGDLNLRSLTSIPEGVPLTVGGGLYLKDKTTKTENKPSNPLTWQDGKYIRADGILSEVVNKRGNVYRVQIVGKRDVTYLVTNGNEWSHGKTLREARQDLVYKISDRNPGQFKNLTKKSKLTFQQAVQCYRVITGACAQGVRNFVEQNKLQNIKSITVNDILKKTKGQFGHERFVQFFK